MRNVLVIFRKELHGYFTSPVAYLLLTMFAVVFGLFFWNALGAFVYYSMESQMRGQSFPMNLNEELIRPLLSNINVIGLFFIPMITMRLFAEEKRSGTIELLVTSPIHDLEIIAGKWLAALALYGCMLLVTLINLAFLFKYGQPGLEARRDRVSRHDSASGRNARGRHVHFDVDEKSDHRWRIDFRRVPCALGHRLDRQLRDRDLDAGAFLSLGDNAHGAFLERTARYARHALLHQLDRCRLFPDGALA